MGRGLGLSLLALALASLAALPSLAPSPPRAGRFWLHLAAAGLVDEGVASGELAAWTGRWSLGLPIRLAPRTAYVLVAALRLLAPSLSLQGAAAALLAPVLLGGAAGAFAALSRAGASHLQALAGALAAVALVPAAPSSLPALAERGDLAALVGSSLALSSAAALASGPAPLPAQALALAACALAHPPSAALALLLALASRASLRRVLAAAAAAAGLSAFWLLGRLAYLPFVAGDTPAGALRLGALAQDAAAGRLLDPGSALAPGPHTLLVALALGLALVGGGGGGGGGGGAVRRLLLAAAAAASLALLPAPPPADALLGVLLVLAALCEGAALGTLLEGALPGRAAGAAAVAWLAWCAASLAWPAPFSQVERSILLERVELSDGVGGLVGLSSELPLREHTAALVILGGGAAGAPLPGVSSLAPLGRWHEALQRAGGRDPALFPILMARHGVRTFISQREALIADVPRASPLEGAEQVAFVREAWAATGDAGSEGWRQPVMFLVERPEPLLQRALARPELPPGAKGWVALPVGFDPAMAARSGGTPVGTALASPAFLAVRAEPGAALEVRYGVPPIELAGMLASALTAAALAGGLAVSAMRVGGAHMGAAAAASAPPGWKARARCPE